jgi:glyoxylase-like metal-dependent hydrolase (beta-lactamase superfamily II)
MLHCLSLPTPFPVGPVNVYLAEGDPLTLIDTGPKDDAALAALEAGLAERGHRVEDLRRIVLTHHHADHIGLAAQLAARSGAEVFTHPYNLPWLVDYAAERERHRPFFQQIWDEGGVPEDIVQAMDRAGMGIARWLDPFTEAKPIREGDTVTFENRDWRLEIFHTPGHAGGLICLWEASTRTLVANDHFIRDISSNPVLEPPPLMNGPRPKRLVEYLHQMQRMAALGPRVALPGHGEVIEDVPGLVRQRLAFHKRRAQKILHVLAARPLTLWELVRPLFPRLSQGMDYFLALSEILGHLDLLEEEGKVKPLRDGNVVKWRALVAGD